MIDHNEFNEEDFFLNDERAQNEKADVQGLVPFFVMCAFLFIAFVFYISTGG